ncbi:MAG TPA: cytochrome C oxidase subunit IV family protein [Bryobacteraceae bacterium]|jgi:cytochrome c oxidase subunit IV|nr:cytochrome C oxidase subunit IV family protein [Bryobacteraceae bacterium]
MHPVTPVRTYVLIWAVLTILTFVTFYVSTINLGAFNVVVALGIAAFKMSLVIWFFMHVRTDNPLTKLFVFAGFFWMAILLALTLGDYFSRAWMPLGKFW